jgi:ABC-type enterochelin transport system permease subunit
LGANRRMTGEQKRGRAYMLVAILTVLMLDIAVNALSLVAGEFAWSDVVRVLLTFLLCWFVWRGSRIGYILMLLCVVLGFVYAALVASRMSMLFSGLAFGVMSAVAIALLAPATRAFTAFQRRKRGQQPAAGDTRHSC